MTGADIGAGITGDLDRRRFWIIVTALSLLSAVGVMVALADDGIIDLRVYRMGGEVLIAGGQLYEAHLPGSGLPFTYPPFAAVLMVPLAAVPWPVAVVIWTAVSILCLAAVWRVSLPASFWSALPVRWRNRRSWLLAAITLASLAMEPVWQTLQFGQINLLLMAMILLDIVGGERRWRGAAVGVAAGLKLTPVLFLGLLVVTGQWKALRNAVLGLLATVAVGFAVVPNQSVDYWTRVIRDAERIGGLAFTANQSVRGFLTRIGDDAAYVQPLWFVLSSAIALTALWLARRLWRRDERVASVSVCALAALFASPVSWSHHWVWAIPLGVTLVASVPAGARRWVTGVVWFAVLTIRPIWWVPYRDDRELHWTFWQALPGNAYLIIGIATLAWLVATSRTGRSGAAAAQPAKSSSNPPTV